MSEKLEKGENNYEKSNTVLEVPTHPLEALRADFQ
jgi:hypothetical protein